MRDPLKYEGRDCPPPDMDPMTPGEFYTLLTVFGAFAVLWTWATR